MASTVGQIFRAFGDEYKKSPLRVKVRHRHRHTCGGGACANPLPSSPRSWTAS